MYKSHVDGVGDTDYYDDDYDGDGDSNDDDDDDVGGW